MMSLEPLVLGRRGVAMMLSQKNCLAYIYRWTCERWGWRFSLTSKKAVKGVFAAFLYACLGYSFFIYTYYM